VEEVFHSLAHWGKKGTAVSSAPDGAKSGECLWCHGDMDERQGLIVRGRVNPNNPLIVWLFGPGALLINLGFIEGPLESSCAALTGVWLLPPESSSEVRP